MHKLSWFRRLFMNYESLRLHFASQTNADNNEHDELVGLRAKQVAIEKNLADNDEYIKLLKHNITELESKIKEYREENISLVERNKRAEADLREWDIKNGEFSKTYSELKAKLDESQKSKENLNQLMSSSFETLRKIDKTFFGASGNKGKGNLGELQLAALLEKSGLGDDFYTTNLMVGQNVVEFAIRSDGEEKKWIPVDSKVLDVEFDEENRIIINDAYLAKVATQAKEVSKYLGKTNTADYGLLVLQSDVIYLDMFHFKPEFFQRMITENKVYITSPSSFIQFAWSVSKIIDIFKKVHSDEKIYTQMSELIDTVRKLGINLQKTQKTFNIAMDTHYQTFEKRTVALEKALDKSGKKLPKLFEEESED